MDDAVNEARVANARRWLERNYPLAIDRMSGKIMLFIRRTAVEPKSRKQKIAIVTLAYALTLVHSERETLLKALLDGRPRKGALREPGRIFIEALVQCEPGLPASKLYSRWTKAVLHLRARGIEPSEIENLSQQRGEGIDQWARGGSARATKQVRTGSKLKGHTIVSIATGSDQEFWQIDDPSQLVKLRRLLQSATRLIE